MTFLPSGAINKVGLFIISLILQSQCARNKNRQECISVGCELPTHLLGVCMARHTVGGKHGGAYPEGDHAWCGVCLGACVIGGVPGAHVWWGGVWQGSMHARGSMCGGRHACPGRGHAWQGVCMAGGMCGRGCAWQGACVAGGNAWHAAPPLLWTE